MDLIKFLDDHSGAVVAVATVAYMAVTLLLWLEARASRIASSDAARVIVRYGVSRSGRITDVAELVNFGPALATDVRLDLMFINGNDEVVERRSLVFPTLGPGDSVTIMPGLMLPRKVMVPTAREMAADGRRLQFRWEWQDRRRRWLLVPGSKHSARVEIDLTAYADTVAEGLLVMPSSVESTLEQMREDRKRERHEDHAQRFFDDQSDLPPDLRASIDADRLEKKVKLWAARAKHLARWLLARLDPRSSRE